MGLEKEMERYGAFQGSSPINSSPVPPENIEAVVNLIEPCACIYRDLPEQRSYRIPSATENPAVHRGMLRRWIRNFHEANRMELPKGFYRRDKKQLQGMFYGMLRQYDIKMEQITGPRY